MKLETARVMQTACLTSELLTELVAGRLSDHEAGEVLHHLDECSRCEELLESVESEIARSDPLLAAIQQAGEEIPFAEESESRKAVQRIKARKGTDVSQAGRDTLAFSSIPAPPPRQLRDYELQEPLGDGGMGMVYRARHARLDRIVAIKLIRPERLASVPARDRFNREMRIAGLLEHPNIVRAMDAGEENGQHYLVMEFVAGETLRELIQRRGPLAVEDACDLIIQAAAGLQHIHEAGLVHRDIKPSNLMRCGGGDQRVADIDGAGEQCARHPRGHAGSGQESNADIRLKILDLGLALLTEAGAGDDDLTSHDQVMGTYDYIAPEQAKRSHSVDIRADVYSLGCTFYFLLTGRPPFPDTSIPQKLLAHQLDDPEAVSSFREDVSDDVEAVMNRMMAKSPGDRFASPADVVSALEGIHGGSTSTRSPARKPAKRGQPAQRVRSAVRKFAVVLGCVVCAALAALALRQIAIKTPQGEVIIELADGVDPGDFRIEVVGNGGVHIADADNNWTINIDEGTYSATLRGNADNLELEPGQIRVLRNETKRVSVTLRAPPPEPFVAEFVSAERQVAKRVIAAGGKIACFGNEAAFISQASDLPPDPLEIHTVDLTRAAWSDEDLQQLQTLPNLDRLIIGPPRPTAAAKSQSSTFAWTPEAIEMLTRLPTVRVLQSHDVAMNGELLSQFAAAQQLRLFAFSGADGISSEQLDQLRESLPDCRIFSDVDESLSDVAVAQATEELLPVDISRRVARWVLSLRGNICINAQQNVDLTELSQLPEEPFRLTSIDLRSCRHSTESLRRMCGLNCLARLYLGHLWSPARLHSSTINVLAECGLPGLRHLYIYHVLIDDVGLKNLSRLSQVFELALDDTLITDAGLKFIAELPNLRHLFLTRSRVTGSGLVHFADHDIQVLFLVEAPLTEVNFLAMPDWPNLKKLRLDGTPLTDRAIHSLKRYPTLQELGLNLLTNTTHQAWSVFEHLPELKQVRFRVNPNSVDDRLFPYLKACTKLQSLDVEMCSVTDDGLKQLEGLPLSYLDISGCRRLTAEGVRELKKLLPDCRIVSGLDGPRVKRQSPTKPGLLLPN